MFTQLRNGPAVPDVVLDLIFRLDARGIKFAIAGDALRVSGPDGKPDLSPSEADEIRQRKPHIMAVIAYVDARAASPIDL